MIDIQDELIRTIDVLVNRAISNLKIPQTVGSVVLKKNGTKYVVIINGTNYEVSDGVSCSPTVGSAVWVHMPNGDPKTAFIIGKK